MPMLQHLGLSSVPHRATAAAVALPDRSASVLAGAAVAAAVGASVLVVHPHVRAGFGAHASLKSACALAACLAAIFVARRAFTASRVVVVLTALQLLSAVSALARGASLQEIATGIAAPLLVLLGSSVAVDAEARRWTVRAVGVAAAVAALVALVEIHLVELPWSHLRRPQSTLVNRNFLAHYLAAASPLLLVAATTRRREALRLVALAACACVLLVTRCRAAWLALVVIGSVWLVLRVAGGARPWREVGAAHVRSLAAIAAGLALSWLPTRLSFTAGIGDVAGRLLEHEQGSGAGRIAQMKVGAAIAVANPLFGVGLGGWPRELASHPELRAALPDASGRTPNSDLVRTLVEGGAPCAIALAATLVLVAMAFARASVERHRPATLVPLASGLVIAIIAVFDAPLFRPETSLLFGVALAAIPAKRPTWRLPTWPLCALATLALLACVREAWPP
jgi:hypothetical protein